MDVYFLVSRYCLHILNLLRSESFDFWRCESPPSLGMAPCSDFLYMSNPVSITSHVLLRIVNCANLDIIKLIPPTPLPHLSPGFRNSPALKRELKHNDWGRVATFQKMILHPLILTMSASRKSPGLPLAPIGHQFSSPQPGLEVGISRFACWFSNPELLTS